MGLFSRFPYTNFHELNLDWILRKLRELTDKVDKLKLQGLPGGGTAGQILTKKSVTDFDAEWKDPYTLPVAAADTLGGIKAPAKFESDTVPVRIGEDGRLYCEPSADPYTLPVAAADTLGGIKAPAKFESDTVPVRVGEDGRLYCEPAAAPAASAAVGTGKLYEYTFPYTETGGVVTLPGQLMNDTILSEQTFGIIDIVFSHNPGIYSAALKVVPIPTRVYFAAGISTTVALYGMVVETGNILHVGDLESGYGAGDWYFHYAADVACSPALSDSLMLRWCCSDSNRIENTIEGM